MGTVIKKEFWTVEQIFRFVDERLDKHAFYNWGGWMQVQVRER